MMWVWTSMPWFTPVLRAGQDAELYARQARAAYDGRPLGGGSHETFRRRSAENHRVRVRHRRPRRRLRPPGRGREGDRAAHVRPQLRRIGDERRLALVARREPRPAVDVQQQLLPDPARQGLDAVGLGAVRRDRRDARRPGRAGRCAAHEDAQDARLSARGSGREDDRRQLRRVLALPSRPRGERQSLHCGDALLQETEYDAIFGPTPQKFGFIPAGYEKLRTNPVVKLKGDHDVFGDGSVIIVSTPGHTPGHQSLLVRLQRTGVVILSGDLTHFQANWDARRVPGMNFNRDQTMASMEKVAALVVTEKAQFWINHDQAQSAKMPRPPAYLD